MPPPLRPCSGLRCALGTTSGWGRWWRENDGRGKSPHSLQPSAALPFSATPSAGTPRNAPIAFFKNNYLFDIYTQCGYIIYVIKSFADKETELIYNQQFSRRLPNTIQKVALRKLMMIDNATSLEDLRVPQVIILSSFSGTEKVSIQSA